MSKTGFQVHVMSKTHEVPYSKWPFHGSSAVFEPVPVEGASVWPTRDLAERDRRAYAFTRNGRFTVEAVEVRELVTP